MRNRSCKLGAGIGLAALSPSVHAAELEDTLTVIGQIPIYMLVGFAIVVAVYAAFRRSRDKRRASVDKILDERNAIHSVRPETPIAECVRKMSAEKIGALLVMDGEKLVGIFTERDALTKVLAAGLDPGNTKVAQVMTKDPYCIAPTMTVGDAMELVTARRFRHLPIVTNGKVLAVISSGDLTHWLVKDQVGEVQELVDLAARS